VYKPQTAVQDFLRWLCHFTGTHVTEHYCVTRLLEVAMSLYR